MLRGDARARRPAAVKYKGGVEGRADVTQCRLAVPIPLARGIDALIAMPRFPR